MPKMNPLWLLPAALAVWFLIWFNLPAAKGQNIIFKAAERSDVVPTLERMKRAILAVENTQWNVRGAAREVTSYQIMPEVWEQWSFMPVAEAACDTPKARAEADLVVNKHLAWIRKCVARDGYSVTPYAMALVYKGGYGRFIAYKTRVQDIEYARRASNLYEDKK